MLEVGFLWQHLALDKQTWLSAASRPGHFQRQPVVTGDDQTVAKERPEQIHASKPEGERCPIFPIRCLARCLHRQSRLR